MQTRHPLRAALVATVAPLIAILAFGNSWFTEHVRLEPDHGPLTSRLLSTLAPFTWTVTPRDGPKQGTIWFASWLGILAVLGATFLLTWAIARHATGSSLFVGAWAATIPAGMLGAFVTTIVAYGAFFGNNDVDGTGRFWYSVFQSQNVALWGVWMGLIVGALAAVTVGGVDNRPDYVTSAPIPGSVPVWQPTVAPPPAPVAAPAPWPEQPVSQTYVSPPVYTGAPVGAPPPLQPPPAAAPQAPAHQTGDPTVVMVQPGAPAPPPPPSTGS